MIAHDWIDHVMLAQRCGWKAGVRVDETEGFGCCDFWVTDKGLGRIIYSLHVCYSGGKAMGAFDGTDDVRAGDIPRIMVNNKGLTAYVKVPANSG